jgi:hypothetical protein
MQGSLVLHHPRLTIISKHIIYPIEQYDQPVLCSVHATEREVACNWRLHFDKKKVRHEEIHE